MLTVIITIAINTDTIFPRFSILGICTCHNSLLYIQLCKFYIKTFHVLVQKHYIMYNITNVKNHIQFCNMIIIVDFKGIQWSSAKKSSYYNYSNWVNNANALCATLIFIIVGYKYYFNNRYFLLLNHNIPTSYIIL